MTKELLQLNETRQMYEQRRIATEEQSWNGQKERLLGVCVRGGVVVA